MEGHHETLKVALRVIAAVTEFRQPEDDDIQALRSYAPAFNGQPPDDLACEVIHQILRERAGMSSSVAARSDGATPDASIGPAKDKDNMRVMM